MKNVNNSRGISSLFGMFSNSSSDSLEINQGELVFVGGSKYESIPIELVDSLSFLPRDEEWQEVSIKILEKGTFNYYLNGDVENLQKAVEQINHELEPTQPICKFILSAKQGSLSGKD